MFISVVRWYYFVVFGLRSFQVIHVNTRLFLLNAVAVKATNYFDTYLIPLLF